MEKFAFVLSLMGISLGAELSTRVHLDFYRIMRLYDDAQSGLENLATFSN